MAPPYVSASSKEVQDDASTPLTAYRSHAQSLRIQEEEDPSGINHYFVRWKMTLESP